MVDISEGITKHMQGLPAVDPITGQEVVIEEYSAEEQLVVDLLDHFTYSQMMCLLEPNTILKKHDQRQGSDNGRGRRRMSFQAMSSSIGALDVKQFLSRLQTGKEVKASGGIKVKDNSIAPDIKAANAHSEITSSSVRVISDLDSNSIETSYFKSIGKVKGIRLIEQHIAFWVGVGVVAALMSAIGVAVTMHLLHDVSYAFVPALFCLCIGTSSVFTGLNVLKMRAAKQLKRCIRFPALYGDAVDLDDLLKRVSMHFALTLSFSLSLSLSLYFS